MGKQITCRKKRNTNKNWRNDLRNKCTVCVTEQALPEMSDASTYLSAVGRKPVTYKLSSANALNVIMITPHQPACRIPPTQFLIRFTSATNAHTVKAADCAANITKPVSRRSYTHGCFQTQFKTKLATPQHNTPTTQIQRTVATSGSCLE